MLERLGAMLTTQSDASYSATQGCAVWFLWRGGAVKFGRHSHGEVG